MVISQPLNDSRHRRIRMKKLLPPAFANNIIELFKAAPFFAIETIETIVEIVDAELMEDIQYLSMGKTPADRVKTLLGKLDSVRRSKELAMK